VRRFRADEEIQALLTELRERGAGSEPEPFSPEGAASLKEEEPDLESIRARGYAYERLDQLTMELLMGVR
ncbi:MAG: hypothetical protein R3314_14970, partial [Longimicrobiales bacterium]|nr:hypothetical protein [Longimicrobiales bacterium]